MITGILFDMDGVLIDSEPIILQAAIAYFDSIGIVVKPEDFTPFIGAGERQFLCGVAEKYHETIDFEKARKALFSLYGELAAEAGPLEGVSRFLRNGHNAGLKMAVASSASREKVLMNLVSIGCKETDFDLVVSGDMISRNKPEPDIYQLAALSMGLATQDCLVMEDALNGIVSAKRAKCTVCGLTTTFTVNQLFEAGADLVVSSLDSFEDFSSIEEFNGLLQSMTSPQDDGIVYGAVKIIPAASLQDKDQLLSLAMREAYAKRKKAYTPYSGYKVGASVISAATNRVYSGCNVENSSYGATICAERNAILQAISSEGKVGVSLLVVVSEDTPPAPPCAQCLQVLAEFSRPETEIHLVDTAFIEKNGNGTHVIYSFSDLLPHPFIFPSMRQ
ncbi:cytidine deaminase, homotetrameric [Sphaerochaeta pleomorpha str. Grapes]|uniref:Cytidine deaminase n=1 Tax=Sphaerochaeta pleomorpha (strain ATCC BAA-1885 / DSM 22778 / Grapes) TaxID=158190 RepID=G8QVW7_SPHPG|nr:cytidine deaminase [Sphaerochaeta pleomorpha]AEV30491.1 cytidine deaminase, homotetrameric [Sphaerochaeta pleomorpha str. Grapes]